MPSKIDKIKINDLGEQFDKRKVVTSDDKLEMKKMWESGDYTQTEIAKIYNCSIRVVWSAIYPERAKESNRRSYLNKKENNNHYRNLTEYQVELRNRKKEIIKEKDLHD